MKFNVANPRWAALLGVAVGVAGGVLAGILVGDRRARREFEQELDELKSHYNSRIKAAVASVRNEYAAVVITTELSGATEPVEDDPEAWVKRQLGPMVADELNRADEEGVPADGAVREFERLPPPDAVVIRDGPEREDVMAAQAERDHSRPYVISHLEYHEDELAYQKLPITYYAKDNVLCDDKDSPIPDTMFTVGDGFTKKFGQMSNDPELVYIRNEKLEIDFEVTRDSRSFTQVVLGYSDPDPKVLKRIVRRPGDA